MYPGNPNDGSERTAWAVGFHDGCVVERCGARRRPVEQAPAVTAVYATAGLQATTTSQVTAVEDEYGQPSGVSSPLVHCVRGESLYGVEIADPHWFPAGPRG